MKIKVFLQDLNDKEFANFLKTKYGVTNKAFCNKKLFDTNFLYTTTEIEVDDILTEEERVWLEDYLRPYKDRIVDITKEKSPGRYENQMYSLKMSLTSEASSLGKEYVTFTPKFRENEMFRSLEPDRYYSLEQLGLFTQEDKTIITRSCFNPKITSPFFKFKKARIHISNLNEPIEFELSSQNFTSLKRYLLLSDPYSESFIQNDFTKSQQCQYKTIIEKMSRDKFPFLLLLGLNLGTHIHYHAARNLIDVLQLKDTSSVSSIINKIASLTNDWIYNRIATYLIEKSQQDVKLATNSCNEVEFYND